MAQRGNSRGTLIAVIVAGVICLGAIAFGFTKIPTGIFSSAASPAKDTTSQKLCQFHLPYKAAIGGATTPEAAATSFAKNEDPTYVAGTWKRFVTPISAKDMLLEGSGYTQQLIATTASDGTWTIIGWQRCS